MEYLWKTDYYVDENALSVNVNRLRKKLEQIDVRDLSSQKGNWVFGMIVLHYLKIDYWPSSCF